MHILTESLMVRAGGITGPGSIGFDTSADETHATTDPTTDETERGA